MARAYIAVVLALQAIYAWAAIGDALGPKALGMHLLAAGLLALPLLSPDPTWTVRVLTTVPAVIAATYWAAHTSPLGTVAWGAWAVVTVWLCVPAGRRSPDTLAGSAHPRPQESHP